MLTTWLVSHLAWIGGFLLAVLLLAHIIRQRRPPTSTIAWVLFIAIAPYLGVSFYLLFGGRKVARELYHKIDELTKPLEKGNSPSALEKPRKRLLLTGNTLINGLNKTMTNADR